LPNNKLPIIYFFPRRNCGAGFEEKVTKKSSPPGPAPFGRDCRKKATKFAWLSKIKSVTTFVQSQALTRLTDREYCYKALN